MHLEWNLCEQANALTIWPVCRSSKQIAQESLLFLCDSVSEAPFLLLEELYFFSSYLKLGIALMIFFISSGERRG
jgi:hypothetical protein